MNHKGAVVKAASCEIMWRRSRACDGGACVEVASLNDLIAVRDSKQPNGPVITYQPTGWRAFVEKAKNGAFDTLM